MDSRTRPISEQPSEWEGYKKLVVSSRSNKYRYIIIVKSNSSFIICYLPFIRYLSFHVHRFEKF